MQFSKFLKSAAIVLPLVVTTACTSSKVDNVDNSIVETGNKNNNGLSGSEAQKLQQLQQVNTVYFDFDKYTIQSQYTAILDSHADFLRAHPTFGITIEGHADERGTPEYNIALGERRAIAVKEYLQGRGVLAKQISIVSYGKEKPAVLGHNADAYAKNRRAVIVY